LSKFPHIYSSGTVDQWPKNVTCALMYGNMWKIPAPDVLRTDYLVVMGGNPEASGGSLLACPDVLGELDAIRARGGHVVVIDPGVPAPSTTPTSGSRSCPAPTPRSSSRCARCSSKRTSSTLGDVATR
jgi:hypothetical protein